MALPTDEQLELNERASVPEAFNETSNEETPRRLSEWKELRAQYIQECESHRGRPSSKTGKQAAFEKIQQQFSSEQELREFFYWSVKQPSAPPPSLRLSKDDYLEFYRTFDFSDPQASLHFGHLAHDFVYDYDVRDLIPLGKFGRYTYYLEPSGAPIDAFTDPGDGMCTIDAFTDPSDRMCTPWLYNLRPLRSPRRREVIGKPGLLPTKTSGGPIEFCSINLAVKNYLPEYLVEVPLPAGEPFYAYFLGHLVYNGAEETEFDEFWETRYSVVLRFSPGGASIWIVDMVDEKTDESWQCIALSMLSRAWVPTWLPGDRKTRRFSAIRLMDASQLGIANSELFSDPDAALDTAVKSFAHRLRVYTTEESTIEAFLADRPLGTTTLSVQGQISEVELVDSGYSDETGASDDDEIASACNYNVVTGPFDLFDSRDANDYNDHDDYNDAPATLDSPDTCGPSRAFGSYREIGSHREVISHRESGSRDSGPHDESSASDADNSNAGTVDDDGDLRSPRTSGPHRDFAPFHALDSHREFGSHSEISASDTDIDVYNGHFRRSRAFGSHHKLGSHREIGSYGDSDPPAHTALTTTSAPPTPAPKPTVAPSARTAASAPTTSTSKMTMAPLTLPEPSALSVFPALTVNSAPPT